MFADSDECKYMFLDGPAPQAVANLAAESVLEIRCSSASSAAHVDGMDTQSQTP